MNIKFWEKLKVSDELSAVDRITIFLAEYLGTTFLMFVGCLGCTSSSRGPIVLPRSAMQIGLTFGFSYLLAIQCFAHISGGHINPIITFGAFMTGNLALIEVPIYFIAQFLGSLSGYGLIRLLLLKEHIYPNFPLVRESGICGVGLNPDLTPAQGLFLEAIISFAFVSVAVSIWDLRNAHNVDTVPIKLGLAVVCIVTTAGPFTSAHMNPVRSIGPSIINNFWDYHWIYWVGPFLGSLLSSLCFSIFFSN